MATTLAAGLMTADEYLRLPDNGVPTELVHGKVVEINRPYTAHGYFTMRIGHILQSFLDQHDIGRIGGADAGVVTEHDPDTVRGPDVAFYSYNRIPRGRFPRETGPQRPNLSSRFDPTMTGGSRSITRSASISMPV